MLRLFRDFGVNGIRSLINNYYNKGAYSGFGVRTCSCSTLRTVSSSSSSALLMSAKLFFMPVSWMLIMCARFESTMCTLVLFFACAIQLSPSAQSHSRTIALFGGDLALRPGLAPQLAPLGTYQRAPQATQRSWRRIRSLLRASRPAPRARTSDPPIGYYSWSIKIRQSDTTPGRLRSANRILLRVD
eukprot:7974711-Pyramimonas_sp.AAC.1